MTEGPRKTDTDPGRESYAATPLRVRAEAIAGRMSIGPLTPAESEKGVDIIFDLLRENHRLSNECGRYKAALRELQFIGGDELSRDECVRVLAIARGFAARMLGAKCIGGTLAPEIEALAERAHRV